VVRCLEVFSGFCYTQLSDTYQEANGLLTMDRAPKFPIADIARATRGKERVVAPGANAAPAADEVEDAAGREGAPGEEGVH
jgi:hypothetical protein